MNGKRRPKTVGFVVAAIIALFLLAMPVSAIARSGGAWSLFPANDVAATAGGEGQSSDGGLLAMLFGFGADDGSSDEGEEGYESLVVVEETEDSPIYSTITDDEIAENMKTGEGDADFETAISLYAGTTPSSTVQTLDGVDRYDTSARQALTGWETSDYVIIVTGEKFPDALAASSLAGAYECPILLTTPHQLTTYAKAALETLQVKKAIVIGSVDAVAESVVDELKSMGIAMLARLGGETRYDTQMAIYEYGKKNGLWNNDLVILASGQDVAFSDALSASPIAYTEAAPLFLVNEDLVLDDVQTSALRAAGGFSHGLVIGGKVRVSTGAESALKSFASNVERLDGEDRYETSARTAAWGVANGLTYEGAGFATGTAPWDALGGGALQGRQGSVILLVTDGNTDHAIDLIQRAGGISTMRIFGGTKALDNGVQGSLFNALFFMNVMNTDYDVWLENFAEIQANRSGEQEKDVLQTLDPDKYAYWGAEFYQYALLSDGYSGNVTADDLNRLIASKVTYQESRYGVRSNLRETGQYFIDAAKRFDVNEVYLLAHAAIESAWGCSSLSQGTVAGYEGFYNFYGIGAYDADPANGGAALAKTNGWNTTEKAILGAAEWIAKNYVHSTSEEAGAQNTLYKMRWDVLRAEKGLDPWHQYATSLTWATGIAQTMSSCYSFLELNMSATGLEFDVPTYRRHTV